MKLIKLLVELKQRIYINAAFKKTARYYGASMYVAVNSSQ